MASGRVQHRNRPAHRLEVAADPVVVVLRGALEVDVGGVDERRQLVNNRSLGATVGDEDVQKPPVADFACSVADELPADKRLVVGVGEADVAAPVAQTADAAAISNAASLVFMRSLPKVAA